MDIPLRLRLAYANYLGEVYCDRKPVRCDAQPPSRHSPYTGKGAESDGRHWLSSLVASVGSNQSGETLLHADPEANATLLSPRVATVVMETRTPPSLPNADPQPQCVSEKREATDPSAAPSLQPCDDIRDGPQLPHTETLVDETQPESPHTPSASFSRTAPSPPANALEPHAPEVTRVEAAVQASVAVEMEADAAARAREVRVSEELAGTHEALLADVTAALERRLRECVWKTVTLDNAQQQLTCAFHPPSSASPASSSRPPHLLSSTPLTAAAFRASVAAPPRAQLAKQAAPARADASTCMATEQDAARSELADAPTEAPAARAAAAKVAAPLPWLSANRTDASLSDDAKKEIALHLYSLRRQVQQLRDQLEAHESTHYRHVNALRAAQKQRQGRLPLPLRVEIVKAYEDDPVPYRKGPWREADFSAARRGGPGRSAGGMEEDAAGAESYASDDFTEVTSAALTVVSTDDGRASDGARGDDGRGSSVSSTEELFRQRQAAALRARNQQAGARSAAANAASSSRNRLSDSSTDYSSSSTDTSSTSTLTTTTTTSTDNDSDSD
ncbi:conserved hypothetical protein [Leishmania major strain Friedlin]|uniref:Uncharacterized protein n=1 Tax=Leishmania major TaxID=5664 RepID=Q4Q8A9_LEIMA|nr:conserved hypothetical protein [Leishmania major strain Friedlin]CAG9577266.1 hypothetical_protein_-_conserved [Leishmania major strain Friedlin]CAJ05478.1 conserved hypothetical protein [Leishmania major strain Friedlin]|eukprot:XP_001684439.1 conserved hypothetical protein [Leishmania major strain Friedlin]